MLTGQCIAVAARTSVVVEGGTRRRPGSGGHSLTERKGADGSNCPAVVRICAHIDHRRRQRAILTGHSSASILLVNVGERKQSETGTYSEIVLSLSFGLPCIHLNSSKPA
jgi:hypothetical protein